MNKEQARELLTGAVNELLEIQQQAENAAGSFLEATNAQQLARNTEKEAEAAIIEANPNGLFTPRASSAQEKESYLRTTLADTYSARALAEKALVEATYENTVITGRLQTALAKVKALTAILNSFS